ncbi:thymidylate synthase [Dehalogenimonas alkenigignens]|uniref:Thymidylate synthase n=1 Tax=Dehalogenimonas alkenigignens TaxID=1217799 RepID=A0A0W0GJD3_9CHLR|nr:thymidylate synthase [Dehalogenimonas alkenigignens]KTB48671.1 Thymidylate synthase [Dehalogenimonas alkenigignens]PVV84911.1 thymidylate synthase [Dehalogenimonas alkenigignens]
MRASTITARDLSEAWFLCLREVLTHGYEYTIERGSYAGQKRRELDMVTVQILNPGNRPIIPDVPPGVPPPSTMEYLDHYLPYLMTAQRAEGEQYTYGQYLEGQIAEVIRMYKEDGFNTNQAYMTVGNPEAIFLTDPPCLRGIDTRIRYGKLHFIVYFRSWDLWAGFPSNLAAMQLLKEYMACEIGVGDGEIFAVSKGMHLYDYAWDIARTACGLDEI